MADLHKKKALLRKCFFVLSGYLHAAWVAFLRGLCCYRAESGSDRFLHRFCAKIEPPQAPRKRPNGGRCGALCFQNRTTIEPRANHDRTTREPQMNHARTHIKNEKNDNNERCICAHAREKTKGRIVFNFAFGAALAALFCCLRPQHTRRLPRFFYALFAGCGGREADGLFFRNRIMASEKADFADANVNNL